MPHVIEIPTEEKDEKIQISKNYFMASEELETTGQ